MIYKFRFDIDNGCRVDKHTAVVYAENSTDATVKFNKYIESRLKHDEVVTTSVCTLAVLYCDF